MEWRSRSKKRRKIKRRLPNLRAGIMVLSLRFFDNNSKRFQGGPRARERSCGSQGPEREKSSMKSSANLLSRAWKPACYYAPRYRHPKNLQPGPRLAVLLILRWLLSCLDCHLTLPTEPHRAAMRSCVRLIIEKTVQRENLTVTLGLLRTPTISLFLPFSVPSELFAVTISSGSYVVLLELKNFSNGKYLFF